MIGGGPIGLEAAVLLAQQGFEVTLAERGDRIAASVRHWGHVKLFSKNEIRILMVRAPLAVDATAFFFRRRAPSSQIHRLTAKPRAFSISAGWSRCRR